MNFHEIKDNEPTVIESIIIGTLAAGATIVVVAFALAIV